VKTIIMLEQCVGKTVTDVCWNAAAAQACAAAIRSRAAAMETP
jgi:hypothetical protein